MLSSFLSRFPLPLRFAVVGAYNTFFTWLFFLLLAGPLFLAPLASSVLSQAIGASHGWLTHRTLVFRPASPPSLREWLLFNLGCSGVFIVNFASVFIGEHFGVDFVFSSLIGAALGVFFNFIFSRDVVFDQEPSKLSVDESDS